MDELKKPQVHKKKRNYHKSDEQIKITVKKRVRKNEEQPTVTKNKQKKKKIQKKLDVDVSKERPRTKEQRPKKYAGDTKGSKRKKKKRKKLTKIEIEQIKKKKKREATIELIKFILPIAFFAIVMFFFVLSTSPHMVDGNSMNPTLEDKDRVIIRKTKNPNRYEVITFKPPVESKYQYVKRIIGMPGDLIWTEGNNLFINHQAQKLPEASKSSAATELPDGTIKIDVSDTCLEQLSKLDKIPEGYYFVLGDNRNNSSDSRSFGLVSNDSIEGVVSFRYTPFSKMGFVK